MILNQKRKLRTILSLLIIFVTISSGSIITPVACLELNGQIKLETECSDFKTDTQPQENIEQCQICTDIPLWQYSPNISQIAPSDVQKIVFHFTDILSYLDKDKVQNLAHTPYVSCIIEKTEQSQLAIISTRLLL